MVKVTVSPIFGREVTASEFIFKDDEIMACELLVLSPFDTLVLNDTGLQFYTFKYNTLQDCLVLGLGEIFNHDDSPNVSYRLEQRDGRSMMIFKALRDIKSGEQLFIDYSADCPLVDSTKYVDKNLI